MITSTEEKPKCNHELNDRNSTVVVREEKVGKVMVWVCAICGQIIATVN